MDGWDASCSPVAATSKFEGSGYEKAYALAGRLADELDLAHRRVQRIAHSRHLVAVQTAMVFAAVLKRRRLYDGGLEARDDLTPPGRAISEVAAWAHPSVPTAVTILVGHQPMLTEIANALLDNRLPLKVLPLESAESACIELGPRGRLAWCLTSKSEALLAELTAKIRSKYDVAKFLLGALVVNTGLLLNEKLWQSELLTHKFMTAVATAAALAALALTVGTLFAYDRLLMPSPFWSERFRAGARRGWNVDRPPSQLHLTLFYEMVHVWSRFFTPAMGLALFAVGLFAVVQAHRFTTPLIWHLQEPNRWRAGAALMAMEIFLAVAALLLPWLWYDRHRPRLGPED
jgi:phosphohistidine phosphatase SixA